MACSHTGTQGFNTSLPERVDFQRERSEEMALSVHCPHTMNEARLFSQNRPLRGGGRTAELSFLSLLQHLWERHCFWAWTASASPTSEGAPHSYPRPWTVARQPLLSWHCSATTPPPRATPCPLRFPVPALSPSSLSSQADMTTKLLKGASLQ